jgi:bifunctional non-homologous end joining protein LigD
VSGSEIEVDGRLVRLSSRERVVWAATGFTKGDVADYYTRVAPVLLPHVAGRAVTLARFPEGVDEYGWYQTNCRQHPDWLPTVRVGTQDYCTVSNLASLLWAVNVGTIELHPLPATQERPHEPTAVVFDLDPGPPAGLAACCEAACALRESLAALSLVSFPKTSGSLGIHVHVPLAPGHRFADTKAFARRVAEELAAACPDLVVARQTQALRAGKVLVDWGQNDATRSLPAPYSLRAMRVPTAATPLAWQEVERGGDGLVFGPDEVIERLERLGDLFAGALGAAQRLPA